MLTSTAPAPDLTDGGLAELVHGICQDCYPDPGLGDSVTALCGYRTHFLGAEPENSRLECSRCVWVQARWTWPCGH